MLATAAVVALVAMQPASAAPPGLAISVPVSASFGSQAASAGSFSASLGTVRVTTTTGSLLSDTSWVAKVSTTGFTTGAGGLGQVIPPGAVSYSAGPATTSGVGLCTPGSGSLSAQVTAYACSGVSLGLAGSSVAWNPTITVQVSATNTVGTYSGTITHSVA